MPLVAVLNNGWDWNANRLQRPSTNLGLRAAASSPDSDKYFHIPKEQSGSWSYSHANRLQRAGAVRNALIPLLKSDHLRVDPAAAPPPPPSPPPPRPGVFGFWCSRIAISAAGVDLQVIRLQKWNAFIKDGNMRLQCVGTDRTNHDPMFPGRGSTCQVQEWRQQVLGLTIEPCFIISQTMGHSYVNKIAVSSSKDWA